MENNELIYQEYVRIIERRNTLLDSSFNDFKLYGAIGSFFVITGSIKELKFDPLL